MVVALSNLILLLPIACVLAIMLAMTGSMVLRPRDDSVRVFVQIIVWQFALLGLIGIMTKWTWFSLFWAVVLLGFLVQLWFWERGLARNILLLVFSTNCHSNKLRRAIHYLCQEGRGYWRRLGKRFDYVWRATSSWELAFKHTGLAGPTRVRLALANLINQQNANHFHQQVNQVTFEQKQTSQWLGRLLVVSLSFLLLLVVGIYDELQLDPTRDRMWEEFSPGKSLAIQSPWKFVLYWKLYALIPLAVWMPLLLLYALHKIPILARHQPFAWLLRSYYRSLAMDGLADSLQTNPDPIAACNKLAEAMPIPSWARRFQLASQNMLAGQLLPAALVSSGLLRKNEAAAIALCDDAKSIAWTLHQLGQSLLSRTFNRTHRNVQLLAVALPIGAAVLITMYALTTFGTLTALIEAQL